MCPDIGAGLRPECPAAAATTAATAALDQLDDGIPSGIQ